MILLSSPQNPLFKKLRRLASPSGRRPEFLIEGTKLVRTAVESGVPLAQLLLSKTFRARGKAGDLVERLSAGGTPVAELDDRLFRALSHLETPEGILAVGRRTHRSLTSLSGGVLVVTFGVQDPGNLGAIARVTEAAGGEGLVVCGGCDPFGPKAMRGAMGSLLRLPVVETSSPEETLSELKTFGYRLASLSPGGSEDYRSANLSAPIAILLGGEGGGLPESVSRGSDLTLSIPMKEPVESLNVAVVAGVVLYHALID